MRARCDYLTLYAWSENIHMHLPTDVQHRQDKNPTSAHTTYYEALLRTTPKPQTQPQNTYLATTERKKGPIQHNPLGKETRVGGAWRGCLDPTFYQYPFSSSRSFCRRGEAWRWDFQGSCLERHFFPFSSSLTLEKRVLFCDNAENDEDFVKDFRREVSVCRIVLCWNEWVQRKCE